MVPCVLKHSHLPHLFLFLLITVYDLLRKGNMSALTKLLKLTFEGMISTQQRIKRILLIIRKYLIIFLIMQQHWNMRVRWMIEISVAVYFQFACGWNPRYKIVINFLFSPYWLNHHIYNLDRVKKYYISLPLCSCVLKERFVVRILLPKVQLKRAIFMFFILLLKSIWIFLLAVF
jgi:hypothetical protein